MIIGKSMRGRSVVENTDSEHSTTVPNRYHATHYAISVVVWSKFSENFFLDFQVPAHSFTL